MIETVATEIKMPEEQEEQTEEIALSDDDLNVIEELETDQEITESTETAEVEAVAEETQSSDDSSATEEPAGQTFNPDLTARATQYGLDPSGFASEQALQHVVQQFDQGNEQLSRWNNWYQGQQRQTTEEQPPQAPQFRVDLGEDYDDGLKSAINSMAAQMQHHYDNQLNVVAQSILDQQNAIQYQQQYVSLAENQQQQQYAASELEQFNSAVNRLSNEGLFGTEAYETLDAESTEAKNMESLYERMSVLANGYRASNQEVPSVDELVKQAYHATFADEINNQNRNDFNNRMKSNSKRRLGGGGTTAAMTELAGDADEAVNSEVLKDFYDSALAENGS